MSKWLSEREAWRKLAHEWGGPESSTTCEGLCHSINYLHQDGRVDAETSAAMQGQIAALAPPPDRNGYRWPCWDRDSRVVFCRAMVRRLGKKAGKA